jgi:general secretion pathway protein G
MKYNIIKKNEGFTLIELLVVIAIIGLLSSILFGSLSVARASARDSKRYSDVLEINKAIQLYILAKGHAPDLGGTCSSANPGNASACFTIDTNAPTANWTTLQTELKPYLPSLSKDPCGASCPGAYNGSNSGVFFEYRYVTPAEMANYCTVVTCPTTSAPSYQIYAINLERKSGSFGVATFAPFGIPISSGGGGGGGGGGGY